MTNHPNNLTFECLWGVPAPEAREAVKDLWRRYGALDGESQLERRAKQIAYAVRNPEGEVVAVSTAAPARVASLNNHFFYTFRCFVAPSARIPGLDSLLAVKTKSMLEQQEGAERKFKGMLMVIENETLKKLRTTAVWAASQMVFAGYTANGHHIRIGYFKGARI